MCVGGGTFPGGGRFVVSQGDASNAWRNAPEQDSKIKWETFRPLIASSGPDVLSGELVPLEILSPLDTFPGGRL